MTPTAGDRVYQGGQWIVTGPIQEGLVPVRQGERTRDIPLDDLAWDEALRGWIVVADTEEEE